MKPYLSAIIFLSAAVAAGCSSGDGAKSGPVNGPMSANSASTTAANTDVSTDANSNATGNTSLFSRLRNARRPANPVEINEPPQPLRFRPAPENSQIATTMNSQGQPVETRVFKGHPQLMKVEAVWLGPKEKQLRITLRGGHVVEVTTDAVATLQAAPAAQLVQLAQGAK